MNPGGTQSPSRRVASSCKQGTSKRRRSRDSSVTLISATRNMYCLYIRRTRYHLDQCGLQANHPKSLLCDQSHLTAPRSRSWYHCERNARCWYRRSDDVMDGHTSSTHCIFLASRWVSSCLPSSATADTSGPSTSNQSDRMITRGHAIVTVPHPDSFQSQICLTTGRLRVSADPQAARRTAH